MRRVYAIGESIMDIIFKDNVPLAAKAGGSMLNASVSLGRLKIPVCFITEFGNDNLGTLVQGFLTDNGVSTDYSYCYNDGKTAVALAFLDKDQNASYSFYKHYPADRFKIEMPPFSENDIVMFGSYFGISHQIRQTLVKMLVEAKGKGAILIYDPNFRKAHLQQLNELIPFIMENFQLADIIKGSDEDFENIFGMKTAQEAFHKLSDDSKILIYTKGGNGVDFCRKNDALHVDSKTIQPISTIGAGDNFNAGLAFGLMKYNVEKAALYELSSKIWEKIISIGVDFATEVCLTYENYISEAFVQEYFKKLKN